MIFTDANERRILALITLLDPFDSTAAGVTRSGGRKLFSRDRRMFDVEKSRGRHSGARCN